MQMARLGADHLLDVGQERDHVVARGRFDRRDPLGIDDRFDAALGRGADRRGGRLRHLAMPGHCLERCELDLEPEPQPVLRRPDRGHRRAGVAREHRMPGVGSGHLVAANPAPR